MRCLSCNKVLNDSEATRKTVESNTYVDLCNRCFDASDFTGIETMIRPDLLKEENVEQDDGYVGDAEGDNVYDDYID